MHAYVGTCRCTQPSTHRRIMKKKKFTMKSVCVTAITRKSERVLSISAKKTNIDRIYNPRFESFKHSRACPVSVSHDHPTMCTSRKKYQSSVYPRCTLFPNNTMCPLNNNSNVKKTNSYPSYPYNLYLISIHQFQISYNRSRQQSPLFIHR